MPTRLVWAVPALKCMAIVALPTLIFCMISLLQNRYTVDWLYINIQVLGVSLLEILEASPLKLDRYDTLFQLMNQTRVLPRILLIKYYPP